MIEPDARPARSIRRPEMSSPSDRIPKPTIQIEALRDQLLAGRDRNAPKATGTVDVALARAMAAGVPAAWALFQDVVRPRLVSVAVALVDDQKHAVEVADATCGEIYRRRDERGDPGLADLPVDVSLFALCRALVYRRIVPPSIAATLPEDAIAAARALGGGDERFELLASLESKLPGDLRSFSLEDQLARQRPGADEGKNRVRILNLPAVLTLAFLVMTAAAAFYIVEQPRPDRTRRTAAQLEEALIARRFDEAARLLADDPPPGLERLEPVRPESRHQRIRELRARSFERPKVMVIAPIARIDAVRPTVRLDLVDLPGEFRFRLVEAANGRTIVERMIPQGQSIIDVGVDLERGSMYTISVESPHASIRSQFEILSTSERTAIESRIGAVTRLVASQDPVVLSFLRAHVYRSEDCLVASVQEWRKLAQLCPETVYPREEAAFTLDMRLRNPARAILELEPLPPAPADGK